MLLRWTGGLPLSPPLLLLLGPLGPFSPGARAGPAQAEDAVELDFSTERPVHLVSPAFLSFTIDANLATDPRFLTFLGWLDNSKPQFPHLWNGTSTTFLYDCDEDLMR
uniref:Heparanase n=1 Tax=Equus caballus TaxID=9796 RepID=A0A9L0SBQ8_HORSE